MSDSGRPESSPIGGVLRLVQDLTGRAIHSESATELLSAAFHTLFESVPFDVAAAILIEQHLDLYVATREDAGAAVSESLVERLRRLLATVVPTSLAATEVMVRSERHDLPKASTGGGDALRNEVHAVIKQDNRAAGLLVIWRAEPFSDDERKIVEICSIQISVHFSNLRSREKIAALADVDDLTGVPNRRFFRRQINQEIETAAAYNVSLSLLIIDVDDFKEINDAFGHATGDVVLSEICGRIRDLLRTPDWLSRFGGDEFAVVLPHTDLGGACVVADRILNRVRDLSVAADAQRSVRCSVSIGVAELKPGDTTSTDFVRRADDRLYAAKRQGKNRYTF